MNMLLYNSQLTLITGCTTICESLLQCNDCILLSSSTNHITIIIISDYFVGFNLC